MARRHSKTRDYLVYAAIRVLMFIVQMFPINANLRTARFFGWLWYRGIARHRQRARDHLRLAYGDSLMEWIDGNLGSRLTMKYPSVYMMEPGARGEILSIAFATAGQHQDAGAKLVHAAPNTSGRIVSKSISKNGGRSSYRGLVRVEPGAKKSRSSVVCDALILDDMSRSDTYPYIEIEEQDVSIGHEASVSKIGEEQLFYLKSRGLSEAEASTMIVGGFIEPLVKELPMEYAVEMNRLIELQMEGSVG